LIGVQFLTASSGTYTPTSGTRSVLLQGIGGGGAGGTGNSAATTASAGAGGNAGQWIEKYINPGGLITGGAYVCGAAGVAATSDGANSTIVIQTTTRTAGGGKNGFDGLANGIYVAAVSAAYTATSSGDVNSQGLGDVGVTISTSFGWSGAGGYSPWGTPGVPVAKDSSGGSFAGNTATGFGAGGSGGVAFAASSPASQNGGNGAPGAWMVFEYD
jgi:hypothetical protein